MANATVNPVSQIQAIVAARPASGGEAEGSSSFAQALEARRPASQAEPANQAQPRRSEGREQDSNNTSAATQAPQAASSDATSEAGQATADPALTVLLSDEERDDSGVTDAADTTDAGADPLIGMASNADAAANPVATPAILAATAGTREAAAADADADASLIELNAGGAREEATSRNEIRAATTDASTDPTLSLSDDNSSRAPVVRSEGQGSFAETLGNLQAQAGMKPGEAIHDPGARHTVATPVASRGWADEVGQKLVWTASQDNGTAELILTPPQLGRIQVSINLQGDQASASFIAANPLTREALQDAMPRLREILAQAGIQLGQADVGAGHNPQAQHQSNSATRSMASLSRMGGGEAEMPLFASHGAMVSPQGGRSMIDIFA